jgi:hypothetical protein
MTKQGRGGAMGLSGIRDELANAQLSVGKRKSAFDHLRHWLAKHPDDAEAKKLWHRYEAEFGRAAADEPLSTQVHGGGFHALSEAGRRAER